MKRLVYTQETFFGGSPRLLLNLARHLSLEHDVIISFPNKINSQGIPLFDYFYDLVKMPKKQVIDNNYKFDVGIFHLPYSIIDNAREINCSRKIAVIMEIASKTSITLNNSNLHDFDNIIYLHEEQISHFDRNIDSSKLIKLKIINNIDNSPCYHKTRNIGCVGSLKKHNLRDHLRILRSSQGINKLIVYSNYRPDTKKSDIISYIWREIFYRLGKMEFRGTEPVIPKIYQSFDCLLHTPAHGNGTSVVVSDALASGKYVILSPLPAYKQAYGHLDGVFFLDEIGHDLTSLMRSYNQDIYKRISNNYKSIYNRTAILKDWETVITNC